jgi:hypothetical protein
LGLLSLQVISYIAETIFKTLYLKTGLSISGNFHCMESMRAKIVIFYYGILIVDESEALNIMRTWQRVESSGF